MKILIIEPCHLDRRYDVRSLTPNLGPVVVATLLKESGHDVRVVSEYVSKLHDRDFEGVELVGISITTYNAERGFEIARRTRKPVVFGGIHASLMPEESLNYGDYVIRGDGCTITELAACLEDGREGGLESVANLVRMVGGKVVYNKSESRFIDVVPDFSLVKGYYRFNWNRLLRVPLLVNASRGCRHNCDFCAIKSVHNDVRKKHRDTIIADIRSQIDRNRHFLTSFLPRSIWITDDHFFDDMDWAREILEEIGKLKIYYTIMVQARVDVPWNDDLLRLLRRANIGRIYLGIEALSQKTLDIYRKRTTLHTIKEAVRKLKVYKIDVHGLFVFGDDGFQKGDGERVAEFVRNHGLDGALIQPLTPFPGTKFFERMKSEKRMLHERWRDYNGKVVFLPHGLSPADLQREVAACYRKVYSWKNILGRIFSKTTTPKLAIIGDAIIRRIESARMERYALDRLGGLSAEPELAGEEGGGWPASPGMKGSVIAKGL